MGLFSRKPNVEKLIAKNDVEGLVKALKHEEVRDHALEYFRNLLTGKQRHIWVQLVFHYALFDPDEGIRKALVQCLSSTGVDEINRYVDENLALFETHGISALKARGGAIPMAYGQIQRLNDEELADRVQQFRSWMNLNTPRKDLRAHLETRGSVSKTRTSTEKEISIRCEGCGKTYTLGKDAIVVSASATLRDFAGATTIGSSSNLNNTKTTPDLVDSLGPKSWASLDQRTVLKQKTEIRRILSSFSRNVDQWWRCRSCGTIQIYRR